MEEGNYHQECPLGGCLFRYVPPKRLQTPIGLLVVTSHGSENPYSSISHVFSTMNQFLIATATDVPAGTCDLGQLVRLEFRDVGLHPVARRDLPCDRPTGRNYFSSRKSAVQGWGHTRAQNASVVMSVV
jgi:hypothetical protein